MLSKDTKRRLVELGAVILLCLLLNVSDHLILNVILGVGIVVLLLHLLSPRKGQIEEEDEK